LGTPAIKEIAMATNERNYLSNKTRFLLTQQVVAHYAERKLNDIEFAKLMTKELAHPVTASHIAYIRREFGIISTAERGGGVARAATIKRLDSLTDLVADLEQQVEVLRREVRDCVHRSGK
jgi:hypothetical protein